MAGRSHPSRIFLKSVGGPIFRQDGGAILDTCKLATPPRSGRQWQSGGYRLPRPKRLQRVDDPIPWTSQASDLHWLFLLLGSAQSCSLNKQTNFIACPPCDLSAWNLVAKRKKEDATSQVAQTSKVPLEPTPTHTNSICAGSVHFSLTHSLTHSENCTVSSRQPKPMASRHSPKQSEVQHELSWTTAWIRLLA